MLTLAMPQSLPAADRNHSASFRSRDEDRRRQALGHAVLQRDGLVQRPVRQHVQDGREGLLLHHLGLGGHFDERGLHVVGLRAGLQVRALAAMDPAALRAGPLERMRHRRVRAGIDQRTDQRALLERVAHRHRAVDALEALDEIRRHALVDDQAAQRCASLPGRAHSREGDRARGQLQVCARRDDHRVVAAQLQDRPAEALAHPRRDQAAHPRAAGRTDHRHPLGLHQRLARLAAADEQGMQPVGRGARMGLAERSDRFAEQGIAGQRGQRRLLGRLPDHAVAADEGQRAVPRPHSGREIEGRDHADHADGMPGLHHPVARALGGDRQAVQLARQAHREVADVDHLLDLAQPFGQKLPGLQRHQAPQGLLVPAELDAQQAHQLAAHGRGHSAPVQERRVGALDGRFALLGRDQLHAADQGAVDGGAHLVAALDAGSAIDGQRRQKFGNAHGGGIGVK